MESIAIQNSFLIHLNDTQSHSITRDQKHVPHRNINSPIIFNCLPYIIFIIPYIYLPYTLFIISNAFFQLASLLLRISLIMPSVLLGCCLMHWIKLFYLSLEINTKCHFLYVREINETS